MRPHSFLLVIAELLQPSWTSSSTSEQMLFRLGVVSPMSGPIANTGTAFVRGLEWWRDRANEAGGLLTRDGLKLMVELAVVDSHGNATLAGEQVVALYRGVPVRVDALVNTFTAQNIAVNEAMRASDVRRVLLHCSGGTPAQYGDMERGVPRWYYQFGVMVPSSNYATNIFRYVTKEPDRYKNLRIAFIKNTANPFTSYTCDESVLRAREEGMEVVDDMLFEFDGQASEGNARLMRGWLEQIQQSGTKMLMGCTWTEDGILLEQQILRMGMELEVNIILIAPTTERWEEAFPRDAEGMSDGDYVLSPSQWHHTQRFQDSTSIGSTASFAQSYFDRTGSWPNYLLSACVAAGSFFEAALAEVAWGVAAADGGGANVSTAGCSDELKDDRDERLRATMRDLSRETFYGNVRFNRHNQNFGHDAAVVQVLPSIGQSSVLPEVNSQSHITLPIPTWESRRGCPRERPVNDGYRCKAEEDDGQSMIIAVAITGSCLGGFAVIFGTYNIVKSVRRYRAALRVAEAQAVVRLRHAVDCMLVINFPFCVVKLSTFKQHGRLLPHEEARNKGFLFMLDRWEDAVAFSQRNAVCFNSHQWLGFSEPDPQRVHYASVVKAGEAICKMHGIAESRLFLWIDYLSIPQACKASKMAAISSLAVFACLSKFFVVCAPPTIHFDTKRECNPETYSARGWCRLEQWSFMGIHGAQNMYLLEEDSGQRNLSPLCERLEWFEQTVKVMEGSFTVERDKDTLVDVILGLYAFTLVCGHRSSAQQGLIQEHKHAVFPERHFHGLVHKLEVALGDAAAPAGSSNLFSPEDLENILHAREMFFRIQRERAPKEFMEKYALQLSSHESRQSSRQESCGSAADRDLDSRENTFLESTWLGSSSLDSALQVLDDEPVVPRQKSQWSERMSFGTLSGN